MKMYMNMQKKGDIIEYGQFQMREKEASLIYF